jgi:hypothetical protein
MLQRRVTYVEAQCQTVMCYDPIQHPCVAHVGLLERSGHYIYHVL